MAPFVFFSGGQSCSEKTWSKPHPQTGGGNSTAYLYMCSVLRLEFNNKY